MQSGASTVVVSRDAVLGAFARSVVLTVGTRCITRDNCYAGRSEERTPVQQTLGDSQLSIPFLVK